MACPNCGSWSVRSDRSLAGRMVCGRCGSPLSGNGSQGRSQARSQGRRSRRQGRLSTPPGRFLSRLHPTGWGLIALLAIGAGLALLEPPQGRQGAPTPTRGSGSLNLAPITQQPAAQGSGWQPLNP